MTSEKILKTSGVVAAAVTLLVIALYFYQFHGALSNRSQDWANVGAYIGGLLGPFYALLAFISVLETLRQTRLQRELDGLLQSIRHYEEDVKSCYSMTVSCDSPWIWGHDFDAAADIKELPLRTLLQSDSIDWEYHLEQLRDGLSFRRQADGTLFQDRDIWLRAKLAADGLFKFLELYKASGGEIAIYEYYQESYEIARNRLMATDWETV